MLLLKQQNDDIGYLRSLPPTCISYLPSISATRH